MELGFYTVSSKCMGLLAPGIAIHNRIHLGVFKTRPETGGVILSRQNLNESNGLFP